MAAVCRRYTCIYCQIFCQKREGFDTPRHDVFLWRRSRNLRSQAASKAAWQYKAWHGLATRFRPDGPLPVGAMVGELCQAMRKWLAAQDLDWIEDFAATAATFRADLEYIAQQAER